MPMTKYPDLSLLWLLQEEERYNVANSSICGSIWLIWQCIFMEHSNLSHGRGRKLKGIFQIGMWKFQVSRLKCSIRASRIHSSLLLSNILCSLEYLSRPIDWVLVPQSHSEILIPLLECLESGTHLMPCWLALKVEWEWPGQSWWERIVAFDW